MLFDPAVYVGDAETDLAMAELFGGFPQSFFEGYHQHTPIEKNYRLRKPIYQLYHILNHGLLFGAHYITQTKQIIDDIYSIDVTNKFACICRPSAVLPAD